ncbi:unnamed protein product [Amoebophrya sp. A120]|nr:unnamed protein product [Amoebophrya sp. A120]|eukprot:GSA120T00022533001.1
MPLKEETHSDQHYQSPLVVGIRISISVAFSVYWKFFYNTSRANFHPVFLSCGGPRRCSENSSPAVGIFSAAQSPHTQHWIRKSTQHWIRIKIKISAHKVPEA